MMATLAVEDPGLPEASPTAPVLSIVTATFNERANLPALLGRIREQALPPYEILVVDDGSTDGTREMILQAAVEDPRIRPMFHDGRQTLIPAHCQGIKAARGEFVVIMDADLQHPPEILPLIAGKLESGTALVIASRFAGKGSSKECSVGRRFISLGAQLVTKLLVRNARRISDPISGFYGFWRGIFVPVDPRWRGYELLPFILVMGRGVSVAEIPYEFRARKRGVSKIVGRDFGFVRTFLVQIVLVARFARSQGTLVGARRNLRRSDAGTSPVGFRDSGP
jgi:dolichol-phosphate mannosyltransferase